jgi:pimeloyl-ACP methyl ester carboxylesterase
VPSQLDVAGAAHVRLPAPDGPVAALQAGEGVPVLLLPGYTGSKEDFAPVLAPLASAGFAVTAIDLPGQFESPGPDDPAGYTSDRLAVAATAAADALGPSVHLLGHSFGGLVARAAVLNDPDRFRSLVLLGSGPAGIGGRRRALIEQLEPLLARLSPGAVHDAALAARRAQPGWVEPSPELAAFLRHRWVTGSAAALQGMGRAVREEPDRVAELAAWAGPVLVVHGAADDAWPPQVQREMAARLRARHAVVPAAAHSPAVENPAALVDLLAGFWRGIAPES